MQRVSLVMYMFCFAFDMLLVVQKGKQHSVFHLLSIYVHLLLKLFVIPSIMRFIFTFYAICTMYLIFSGNADPTPSRLED